MLTAFDLHRATEEQLRTAVRLCPTHRSGDPGPLRAIVRAIHAIPFLWRERVRVELQQLQVYVGRSNPRRVHNRFRAHFRNQHRVHSMGSVLFKCPTKDVRRIEERGIRLVKTLDQRGSLCVANIANDSRGGLPKSKTAVIYVTWGLFHSPRRIHPPRRRDLSRIARDAGLDPALVGCELEDLPYPRRQAARDTLKWHPDHLEPDPPPPSGPRYPGQVAVFASTRGKSHAARYFPARDRGATESGPVLINDLWMSPTAALRYAGMHGSGRRSWKTRAGETLDEVHRRWLARSKR